MRCAAGRVALGAEASLFFRLWGYTPTPPTPNEGEGGVLSGNAVGAASRRAARCPLLDFQPDLLGDRLGVVERLGRAETDDGVALRPQPLGPHRIAYVDVEQVVHRAVHLDHQPSRMAGEISDVRADRRLTADVETMLAQRRP